MIFLVIKPSSLGDIFHGLQVVASLKEQLPESEVHWVIRDRFEEVVKNCPLVSKYFVYERKKGIFAFIRLLKEIRAEEYDYVLDFQGLLRRGIMTWAAKAKYKFGRSDAREGAWLFYNKRIPMPYAEPANKAHAVEILSAFLPYLGLDDGLNASVPFKRVELNHIDKRIEKSSPIVLFPKSRGAHKEWPGFKTLAQELLALYPQEIIVWDSHIKEDLNYGERFINTAGRTTLMELISLIGRAKLVIANDSGPMHIAAAMGRPVLGLFGPTKPESHGPYPSSLNTNRVLNAPDGVLGNLSVDSVLDVIGEMLDETR